MELDLGLVAHHVVGQSLDLSPQHLAVGFLGPSPLGRLGLAALAAAPDGVPAHGGPSGEQHAEPREPAAAYRRRRHRCPTDQRLVGCRIADPLDEVASTSLVSHPAHRAPAEQLGRLTSRELAAAGAEAVAHDHRVRARPAHRRSQLARHFGRITARGIGGGRRKHRDVDRRVGAADGGTRTSSTSSAESARSASGST